MIGSRLAQGASVVKDWFKITTYIAVGLVAFGFLVLFLAWNGAAEKDTIQQQFPYVISGGLTGLATIILGVAVFVIQDGRRRSAENEELMRELQATLAQVAEGLGASLPDRSMEGLVVAGAASYHDPSCHLAEGRTEADRITPEEARERDLSPCRICKP